jgi:phosphonate transport system ATP-binding protein
MEPERRAVPPMLRIESLVKRYAGGDKALRGVSLDVPEAQILALVGPSGAGKSTLIRCVNRLVEPTSGRVFLRELELTALRGRSLRLARRRIGMIFQEFALVERLTVMENVLSGRLGHVGFWRSLLRRFPEPDVTRALALLERIGLAELLDKRADALSGGQRQRVGIARALLQTRELLLVDEPTANLDPRTARSILRLLAELAREHGLTAVVNLHDIPLAQLFADRVVGLRAGQVVFDGAPAELTPAVLTSIYGEEDWHGQAPATVEEAAP